MISATWDPELFSSRREQVVRKPNFMWIQLQMLFRENMKILVNDVDLLKNYLKLT